MMVRDVPGYCEEWGIFVYSSVLNRMKGLKMKLFQTLYMRYKEIVHYLIVGVLTTVVSLGVYYGLVLTVLDPGNPLLLQLANILSWVAAVTFAYFMSRKFVFESHSTKMRAEAARFYMSRVGTLLLDMLIMFVTVTLLGMNDKLAKLLVQVIVTVLNYIFSKFLVFGKAKDEAP